VDLDKFNEEKALVSALARMTGQRTVPNVFIGGAHIGGCDDTMALKKSGELRKMLTDLGVSFKQA
jgi:glutaredoxin